MQTADEFLAKAMETAYGGPPIYDEGIDPQSLLPWGDAPEPDDRVLEYHPDRPNEPVMWRHTPNYGGYVHGFVDLIKKSFVEDCLEGRVKSIENPRQWLWDKLVAWFSMIVVV